MGPAVNVGDERILGAGPHAERLGQEGLHFILVVVADEREGLDFGDLLARKRLAVEVGHLLRGLTGILDIELRQVGRACKRVGNGSVLRDGPATDRSIPADYHFGVPARCRQAIEAHVPTLLDGEVDGAVR